MFDNIAAISSGSLVNQAISIIRVCGPDSFDIVKKIFSGPIGQGREITYGWIKDDKTLIDEVLVAWFNAKSSFVGENTVEINAHGGIVNTNLILELLLANGCRMAEPGEFSKRAFLNGKMSLIKAEAINDLIHAQTKNQVLKSVTKFNGKTSNLIHEFIDTIEFLIANCETNIDYPELDDIEILTNETLLPKLKNLLIQLEEIEKNSESSRYIFEGVQVAIVGKPNSGKSSLLNALLKENKAIVTNIPGTTRDIVEGIWQTNGILFKIKDTAGIRASDNLVEEIGIQKSFDAIKESELVIHVIDITQPEDEFDKQITDTSKDKKYIKVFNKQDLLKTDINPNYIYISALNNNIKQLENYLIQNFQMINIEDEKMVNNSRQLSLIKSSKIAIKEAIQGLDNGLTPDVIIVDIHKAWEDLYNIIGKPSNEILLNSMFKKFCLGK